VPEELVAAAVTAAHPEEVAAETGGRRGVFRRRKAAVSQEQFERRFSQHFAQAWAQHWAQARAERRQEEAFPDEPSIRAGETNFRPARVPYGVDLAAAWSWRFLVIAAAVVVLAEVVKHLSLVVLPVIVALFITGLVIPVVDVLGRFVDRGIAAFLAVVAVIAVIVVMLSFAAQQVVKGANDLATQVVGGIEEIRKWLQTGPLHVTDKQINDAIDGLQNLVTTSNSQLVERAGSVGTTIGHVVAGFFIVLFSTYFFLSDGNRIWSWVVRLFPRAARARADTSGRVAWLSLTQFVRATVLVALVDSVGVMIVAAILHVPFVFAIGVLVFLGAFIPLVGATISGSVAVLVALVSHGPIVALIMLGGVVGVQQLEAHILQPFLLGRMVRVHPLAVILAIASGAFIAGIPGALVAVPSVAAINAVVVYLNSAPPEPEDADGVAVTPDPEPQPPQ
jgi:predicted PurR-regulated permease PerM